MTPSPQPPHLNMSILRSPPPQLWRWKDHPHVYGMVYINPRIERGREKVGREGGREVGGREVIKEEGNGEGWGGLSRKVTIKQLSP